MLKQVNRYVLATYLKDTGDKRDREDAIGIFKEITDSTERNQRVAAFNSWGSALNDPQKVRRGYYEIFESARARSEICLRLSSFGFHVALQVAYPGVALRNEVVKSLQSSLCAIHGDKVQIPCCHLAIEYHDRD